MPNFLVTYKAIFLNDSKPIAPLNALLLICIQAMARIVVPIPPPTLLIDRDGAFARRTTNLILCSAAAATCRHAGTRSRVAANERRAVSYGEERSARPHWIGRPIIDRSVLDDR